MAWALGGQSGKATRKGFHLSSNPNERRRWPGQARGIPHDGRSQGLRDTKGLPRSPGSTPLASSGCSPCAVSGASPSWEGRRAPRGPGPGQCGLAWRGPWGRRGCGSPGGPTMNGTLELVADASCRSLPSACPLGSGWPGPGLPPSPLSSRLVPGAQGTTVCTTDGRVLASCLSSTAEWLKAF